MKTLEELLKIGENILEKASIRDAKLDAWYLLEFVTHISRVSYLCDREKEISLEKEKKYLELLEQRKNHIPLQQLTGEQEFMGISFFVNEHVLIPRQDTETVVEEALRHIENGMEVLDMCTGSGCILISIACLRELKKAVGADISKEALAVAEKNARRNQKSMLWIETDLFEKIEGFFDVIISNPPYIQRDIIEELDLEVKKYEPRQALDGGKDGLDFYRRLVQQAGSHLKENGYLCLEIGYDQGNAVSKLLQEHGFLDIQVKKDLAGLDRVCIGRWNDKK